jgi:anti-sigma regulatory factor (Ser/Thr protein kinase)
MAALHEASAFIETFGARHGLNTCDVVRLQLIVEELFSNTVAHGYGRECDEPIELVLAIDGASFILIYQDAARAYNPLATLPALEVQLDAPIENRAVGQLGVALVAGLAAEVRYAFIDGRNRLQIRLRGGA